MATLSLARSQQATRALTVTRCCPRPYGARCAVPLVFSRAALPLFSARRGVSVLVPKSSPRAEAEPRPFVCRSGFLRARWYPPFEGIVKSFWPSLCLAASAAWSSAVCSVGLQRAHLANSRSSASSIGICKSAGIQRSHDQSDELV